MVGDDEPGQELADAVHGGRRQGRADQHVDERALLDQEAEHRADGRRLAPRQALWIGHAAHRLTQGEERDRGDQQGRYAQGEEPLPPAYELSEIASRDGADDGPDRRSQPDDGGGRGAPGRRVVVAQQRLDRWAEAGVAGAHADAEQQHLPEVLGHAAARGEDAEKGHAGGDDLRAVHAVGQHRQGQAEACVEQRKAQPLDQPELGVREAEVHLDPRDRGGQTLAVGQVQDVDQEEQEQEPGAIALAEARARAVLGGRRGPRAQGGLGRAHGNPPALLVERFGHQARQSGRLSNAADHPALVTTGSPPRLTRMEQISPSRSS